MNFIRRKNSFGYQDKFFIFFKVVSKKRKRDKIQCEIKYKIIYDHDIHI